MSLGAAPHTEVIVIGAGAVGASTAAHLAKLGHRVALLEKEPQPALHQSGRNSGVIHPGYNLRPGSLKARFCVDGSRRLRAYCAERGLPVRQGGILVVAQNEKECDVLGELERRARANGVQASLVSDTDIRTIEPHTVGVQALHAPEGASFDGPAYVRSLIGDAITAGARVCYNTTVLDIRPGSSGGPDGPVRVQTSTGTMTAQALVSCAGLHADRLAGALAPDVRIIPFRGYYAELTPARRHLVANHVYSVPDLALPFLGAHVSRRVDGRVIVGPGAMLAFGREAYRFRDFQTRDLADMLSWPGLYRLFARPKLWRLLGQEVRKSLSLNAVCDEARHLIPTLAREDMTRSYAGNRAQLVSRQGELIDDIVVRETERTIHVLNAVSPGLTCSLAFGEHLAQRCHAKLEGETSDRFAGQTG
jgi:(S)-2-hydroxyglutarate dehydrogenase